MLFDFYDVLIFSMSINLPFKQEYVIKNTQKK